MNNEKNIEIPFGAKDSELGGWEYTIPEGYEALIEDGKVIVRKTESEDEKTMNFLREVISRFAGVSGPEKERLLSWVERHRNADLARADGEYEVFDGKVTLNGIGNPILLFLGDNRAKKYTDHKVKVLIQDKQEQP